MDATVAVVEVSAVGPNTVAIEFESPAEFEAAPGQFVKLSATVDGEEHSRFYTLSSPDTRGTLEVTVGYEPDEAGPFSRYLLDLSPGDELAMVGPFGSQYYDGEPRVVVLAGGPGVGPAVGIGERALADGAEVAIVYRDETPAHEDRLSALGAGGATVVVTDGQIGDAVEEVLTGAPDEQVFVYGFADFVALTEAAIEAAGGSVAEAKVESFG